MAGVGGEKILFTPGPVTTSRRVREAQVQQLYMYSPEFRACLVEVQQKLLKIVGVENEEEYVCMILQGSGSFSLEAALATSVNKNTGRVLVLSNGFYGIKLSRHCEMLHLVYRLVQFPEAIPISPEQVRQSLREHADTTHVCMVHSETSSGVVNPITEIGAVVKECLPDAVFYIDAMSSFGGIPINMKKCRADYLISGPNKCLQSVPGIGFTIANKQHLLSCRGQADTMVLDLVGQYSHRQIVQLHNMRFTPPVSVILALRQALLELDEEGGVPGRAARYCENQRLLKDGLSNLGLKLAMEERYTGPAVLNFLPPTHPNYDLLGLYNRLDAKGFLIFPMQAMSRPTIRIASIGQLFSDDVHALIKAIKETFVDMGIPVPIEY